MKPSEKKCEFCGRNMAWNALETVCGICDKTLELRFEREDRARAKQHALKHKCRICGTGLTVTRRFNCEDCVPSERISVERRWSKVYCGRSANA